MALMAHIKAANQSRSQGCVVREPWERNWPSIPKLTMLSAWL